MSSIQTIVASLLGVTSLSEETARTKSRRAPQCETLEGRQLLNGSWGGPGTHGVWNAMGSGLGFGTDSRDPAQVQILSGTGGFDKGHGHNFVFAGKGKAGHGMPALSAQAKTDMQTLQTDMKTLESEVPSTVTAQIKADKATIDQALATLTPTQLKALRPAPPSGTTTPPTDPTAMLSNTLKTAGLSDTQITQITTDFQNYQNTLKTIDPTLTAKITADQAALAKDMPAGAGHHIVTLGGGGAGTMGPVFLGHGL
jgi:hypothetical protein